jgi:hypothetical protein
MGAEVVRGHLNVPASLILFASLLAALSISSKPTPLPTSVESLRHVVPDTSARTPHGDSVSFGQIAAGAEYRRVRRPSGETIHVLTIDSQRGIALEAVKADDSYDGLETLSQIYERAERDARRTGDTILAAINAGPWHAERLSPIGPLVVDGDVVELNGDDAYSSLLLYAGGGAAITRDRVAGQIYWKHRQLDIRSVNRRINEDGIVIYNRLYGDFVPGASSKTDAEIVADAIAKREGDDSGIDYDEEELDTAYVIRTYREERARDLRERRSRKIAVRRLPTARRDWYGEPRLNDTMWTAITMIDTGVVPIPRDGYVISLGASADWFNSARPGDTLRLLFQVARNGLGSITDVIPGYPQLLFNGDAAPEPDFAQGPAATVRSEEKSARTAVGVKEDGHTLLLVAVEGPNGNTGGMTIDELASTLRSLGAHNAVALDGRASTTMVVNYETVTHTAGTAPQRRISNALVVKKKRKW